MTDKPTNSGGKLIATALVKAQRQFAPALKNATNPHFKSRYVDLASCVDSVVGALNDNGIFLFQTTSEHPDGIICETSFLHESGERLDCGKLFFPAPKHDPQGFMSCLTYIRRASLMTATSQAPEDDDGNSASKPKTIVQTPAFNESVAADLITAIGDCQNLDELEKAFKAAYKYCVNNETYKVATIKAKDTLKSKLGGLA